MPGTALCPFVDIPDGGSLCIVHDGFPIVLARKGRSVKAYVNACPHQYLPLNHRGEKLLSADGSILRCSNHGAGFSVINGEGVEGLGIGACLDAVPIIISADNQIVVAEVLGELAAVR
ncbi:hypothetical protein IMCC3135_20025 [Granulosicoccus antarcticus IMCC3135]|uniref:Rieske domain-containing protein n=2 Tax=Granulosicoccus TaxID=437504 RepID=A0A2Z2NRT4_9GAMM|nr:hypothetical protein IMCC3135_20025 [Granulosicoccus antarcticus IMCC3135]